MKAIIDPKSTLVLEVVSNYVILNDNAIKTESAEYWYCFIVDCDNNITANNFKYVNGKFESYIPKIIPENISSVQFNLACVELKLTDKITSFIGEQSKDLSKMFSAAMTHKNIQRNFLPIIEILEEIGLTSNDIDDFFIMASRL